MRIPAKGRSSEEIFEALQGFRANDADWRSGRVWGYVYDAGAEVEQLAKRAYMDYLSENALDPTVYPSVLRLENEIVAMVAGHLGGDGETVGNFTSGGTESCMLAVKAARDAFREAHPGAGTPEMVLPITAHAAFHKGAHYCGVKPVVVPVDRSTFKADVDAVRAAITPNTCLIVASAPSYAHGVVDPIRALGALALERAVRLHVDACIGGWVLPFWRQLGSAVTDFDFSVPGVSSISVDLHKYAFCPKAASVLLYRNKELRKHQIFACSNWPGYTVINNTIQSSKSAGPMAAAWAVLNHLGVAGYLEIFGRVRDATQKIVAGIEAIDELRVLGPPEMCLIAFTSEQLSVFNLSDAMSSRGWYVQVQLSFDGGPATCHLSVAPSSVPLVDQLLADLRACVAEVKGQKSGQAAAMVKQLVAGLDPAQLDDAVFGNMLSLMGMQGGDLPDKMAEINEALDAMPAAMLDRILVYYFNDLYRPPKE